MRACVTAVVVGAMVLLAACSDSEPDEGAGGAAGGATTSSGGAGTTTSSGSGGAADLRQRCVELVNEHRATIGRTAYERWTTAEACTDEQAAADAAAGEPNTMLGACGEANVTSCLGWPGPPETMLPTCLQMIWDEGPGGNNYEVLASATYTAAACGLFVEPDGDVWVKVNVE